ncbi:hypothetical protein [Rhizobium binxianense]
MTEPFLRRIGPKIESDFRADAPVQRFTAFFVRPKGRTALYTCVFG